MEVLLLTDDAGFGSCLPALRLLAEVVNQASLTDDLTGNHTRADVAIIDARADLAGARDACRRLAVTAPSVAVIAVVGEADLVAVDVDWCFDDVVLAGASTTELHSRLRLAAARRRNALMETVKFGDLVLHRASYTAALRGRKLDLTLTEFNLLNYLVQHAGQAFTRYRLMHEVWGRECSRRTIDVNVQRLRAKLGAGYESIVETVWGVGYMAAIPSHPDRITSEPVLADVHAS